MVLPAGSTVPPLPYVLVVLAGAALVGWRLWRDRSAVTPEVVLGLVPWMLVGATVHVLYQLRLVPPVLAPLLGSPTVYVSTAVVAGAVWLAVRRADASVLPALGGVGTALFLVAAVAVLALGGPSRVLLPAAALVVGLSLGAGAWLVLDRVRPAAAATTGRVGLLVVLGHAVDAVSTAVGVDLLGFGERTPASRAIMDLAAALPTAEVLGVGWLFVVVKLVVAGVVVVLFAEYVREDPSPGFALLGLIAAVGLGPGVHNLLLYAVAAP